MNNILQWKDQTPDWEKLEDQVTKLIKDRKILLGFAKEVNKSGCTIIDGWDCLSCRASDVLKSVGEEK